MGCAHRQGDQTVSQSPVLAEQVGAEAGSTRTHVSVHVLIDNIHLQVHDIHVHGRTCHVYFLVIATVHVH